MKTEVVKNIEAVTEWLEGLWSAARSAARSAWSAARSAAWSAESAAESAAYKRYADELLKMFQELG